MNPLSTLLRFIRKYLCVSFLVPTLKLFPIFTTVKTTSVTKHEIKKKLDRCNPLPRKVRKN